jgi:hypothetical protein
MNRLPSCPGLTPPRALGQGGRHSQAGAAYPREQRGRADGGKASRKAVAGPARWITELPTALPIAEPAAKAVVTQVKASVTGRLGLPAPVGPART